MTQMYLKISKHSAYYYDGSEERAKELVEKIGNERSRTMYFASIPLAGEEMTKTFTGKIEITGRNGMLYVLPGEYLMHDQETNEWYSVTDEQFFKQYRAFQFTSQVCGASAAAHYDPNCAGASGGDGVERNKIPCPNGAYEINLVQTNDNRSE